MTHTKTDLATAIQDGSRISKQDSDRILNQFIALMKNTLASREDVLISGFGKFSVKSKAPRRSRFPATGDELMLRARKVVTFKPSGKLRDKINGGQR